MKNFILNVLLIIFIGVFCYSGWQLYSSWKEYKDGDEIYESLLDQVAIEPETESNNPSDETSNEGSDTASIADADSDFSSPLHGVDMNALSELNSDAIGWIQIPDSYVDYPIVQADDNDAYLRTTITGKKNKAGSIFADYRIKEPFKEAMTLIYGHNLLNGKMFCDLMKYEKASWRQAHPYIYVHTADGMLQYQVYSCYRTDSSSNTYTFGLETGSEYYQDYLDYTLRKSIFDSGVIPSVSDTIITLSTCTNVNDTERFIVHGVLLSQ